MFPDQILQSLLSQLFLTTHSNKISFNKKSSSSSMASLRTLLKGTAASILKKHLPKNAPPKLAATSHAPLLQLLPITPSKSLISSTLHFRPFSAAKYTTFILSDSESEYSDSESEAVEYCTDVSKMGIFPYHNPCLKAGNRNTLEQQSDEEAARLRVDMPGVEKEGVKIWFENRDLKIEGVELEIAAEDGAGEMDKEARKYAVTFEIPEPELLNKEEARAEMKNGVLKVVIPKLKFEERKDIVHIKIA